MDTLLKDLVYAAARAAKEPRVRDGRDDHDRARHRRRARRSSASSTPCCCGRCRTRTAQRLVIVWGELRDAQRQRLAVLAAGLPRPAAAVDRVFEDIAGLIPAGRTPIGGRGGDPEQIRVGGATPNLFRVLGRASCSAATSSTTTRRRSRSRRRGSSRPPGRRRRRACRRSRSSATASGCAATAATPAIVGTDVDLGNGRAHIVGVLAPEFEMLFPPRANVERVPDMWTAARFNFETRTATTWCSASSDG